MQSESIYKSSAGKQKIMDFYDQVLANWPVPYETQSIDTRYGETAVIVCGDKGAPPIVLLHGSASNAASWAGDVAIYAEQHRVYAVDVVGDAGKSAAIRPDFEGPAFAEWLDDVRAGLGIDTMTLVGLSMGGWIALKYSTTYPERVNTLVLLTPGGIAPHNPIFFLKMMPFFFLGKWGQRRAVQMLFADFPVPDGTVEVMNLIMRHFKPRRETLPLFNDDELASLTCPVIFIGGEKDGLLDVPGTADRLGKWVPHLQTHIIPGGGHAIVHTAGQVVDMLPAVKAVR